MIRSYLAFGGLFVPIDIVLMIVGPSPGVGAVIIALDATFGLLGVWFRFGIARRAWATPPLLAEPQTLIFTAEGIERSSQSAESKVAWTLYPISGERGDFYLLCRRKTAIPVMVPKRGLTSKADEDRLRALLIQHTAAEMS